MGKRLLIFILPVCIFTGIALAQPPRVQTHRVSNMHRPDINHNIHRPPIHHIHYYRPPIRHIGPLYPPPLRYCDPNYFYYYSGGINIRYNSFYSPYPCRYPSVGFSITL